jgi:hypothetical protein
MASVSRAGTFAGGLAGIDLRTQRCMGLAEAGNPDRSRRSEIRPPAGFTPTRRRALVYRGFGAGATGLRGSMAVRRLSVTA